MASGGEAPQGPPVSLSLSLKKKGRAVPAPAAAGFEAVESAEKARTEEVKEVADGHVGEKAPERVIPALPNSFGNLSGLSAASEPGPAADAAVAGAGSKLERDDATPGPAAAAIPAQRAPLDEDAAAAHALLQEAQMDDEARYRCDVAMRADQASDEAYESMPIEEFGRAMLRGMGWKEGEGYNGKPAVEPIEYVARPQLLGLAATPAPEAAPGRQKKYIKPGESREKKKDMVYLDESGRQRHIKRVGDKLVERGPTGLQAGALVAIVSGPHKDLYARVVSTGGVSSDMRAVVRLTGSKEQVSIPVGEVRAVKDVELEKRRQGFTHQQAAAEGAGRDGGKEGGERSGGGERGSGGEGVSGGGGGGVERSGDGAAGDESQHKKHKGSKEQKEHKDDKERRRGGDTSRGDGERSPRGANAGGRDASLRAPENTSRGVKPGSGSAFRRGDGERKLRDADEANAGGRDASMRAPGYSPRQAESNGGSASTGVTPMPAPMPAPNWVREHIRVRIVDKKLQGGALYNKKGVVADTSGGPTMDYTCPGHTWDTGGGPAFDTGGGHTFSVRLDGSPRLVEGLRVSQVETVLPKRAGAAVLLVQGKHRMRRGRLVERHTREARAVLQLTGDFELVTVGFDDVAEWAGPEEELE